jgi:biofilm PGA synthesis N-glycosyltransferase PgaC
LFESHRVSDFVLPETIRGIWKQRIRWAQGGQEVILRHWKVLLHWRYRRIWPIYMEQWVSLLWAYSWVIVTVYYFIIANTIQELLLWLAFPAFALVFLSLIQLWSSLKIDSKYDDILYFYLWAAWYPFVYWVLNATIVMFAFPKAIKSRIKGGYAIWTSPDRGHRKYI